MRFGFLLPHLGMFGAIREVVELGNALIEHGHDVTILHQEGTPCKWLTCLPKIADFTLEEPYDLLLLVTEWRQQDLDRLIASDAKIKGVIVMGFTPSEQLKDSLDDWPHSPVDGELVFGAALHNPDLYLFADGSWQIEWLYDNVSVQAKRGIAIGGVNSRMFVPSSERVRAVTIGASGDTRDRKGLDTVVAAAKIIKEAHPHLDLRTYYGRGLEQSELVHFYQDTTIFLDGHRRGGWCNPVLEAMSCGSVVICTDIGATEFVVNGMNGITVPVNDPEAMAAAALWVLRDENRVRRLSVNARKTAEMLDYRIRAMRLIDFVENELC